MPRSSPAPRETKQIKKSNFAEKREDFCFVFSGWFSLDFFFFFFFLHFQFLFFIFCCEGKLLCEGIRSGPLTAR